VGRRLDLAILISPAFLLVEMRKHFLTVGPSTASSRRWYSRVDKNDIRATRASLEARTGDSAFRFRTTKQERLVVQ
jgi:hypothetical protein